MIKKEFIVVEITRRFLLFHLFLLFLFCAEPQEKKEEEEALAKEQYLPPPNEVGIMILEKGLFYKELVSNGRLMADRQSTLRFEVSGELKNLSVENGDWVQKGQVLASIDPFPYRQALSSAEISLKRAELEFRDMLVSRGYDSGKREGIPDNLYQMAALRSGYMEAENQLENARADVISTTLRAPFSGKIANIKFKLYEQVNQGAEFLTLIDDSVFEVEFYLIESEIGIVKEGEDVEVRPFDTNQTYRGNITSINPVVQENGMVQVKARIKNDGNLLEGMNVKVWIQKELPGKFVVPKSAVILRQNQEVLFKYQRGKAFWTYVETTSENSSSYAIIPHPGKSSASLTVGDTIVISGNLNLAHDSDLKIISRKEWDEIFIGNADGLGSKPK